MEPRETQPDPSPITTQVIWREVASLKELILTKIEGIEKSIEVAHDDLVRFPTEVQKAVETLKDLHEEKFNSIQTQFKERDLRGERESRDNKVAVDAALQAAKELVAQQNTSNSLAISKSEAATTKQIDQQGMLIQATGKASDEKIDDIKDRLTRIESKGEGATAYRTDHRASTGLMIAGISLAVAIIAAIITIILKT